MRANRGASQILFGMLPSQTVDLEGGVWRVSRWVDPVPISIDQATLRRTLLQAVKPWADHGNDGGISTLLYAQEEVQLVRVNELRGVSVERFPKQWRCRQCNRLTTASDRRCTCGSTRFAQMQFVAYHKCGRLQEPQLRRCRTHRQVAVRLPGTAAARELYFYCPECNRELSRGFPYKPCDCGTNERMDLNVHRSGVVFSPHYTVLVNPPDPTEAARLISTGGGARALDWVLNGLSGEDPSAGQQTVQGLEEMLIQTGLTPEFAKQMAQKALERGEVAEGSDGGRVDLPHDVRELAQEEAIDLMTALDRGRLRVQGMIDGSGPPLKALYESSYPPKIKRAGLANVELLTDFPVTTLAFGFTRDGRDPAETTLVPFRDRERGTIRVYGLQAHTEALLFQLDPLQVLDHLRKQGFSLPNTSDAKSARVELLKAVRIPHPGENEPQGLGEAVITLLHSYAHRLIRHLAFNSGIERDELSEYLLPHHLSLIVYASSRGDFVLGGLQSVFETALHLSLESFVAGETRCPLDPGCRAGGGACMACLHLGEPSCRWFNRFLDREVLFGENGFVSNAHHE